MSYVTELSLLAYTLCNALRVVSYVPQIVRIARDHEGARAFTLATWWLWIAANASTVLYAWINLGDIPLALLNGFNVLACLIVVGLTIWKRYSATDNDAAVPAYAIRPAIDRTCLT
jgi:hypothetical protein